MSKKWYKQKVCKKKSGKAENIKALAKKQKIKRKISTFTKKADMI